LEQNGRTYYYHKDGLGSIQSLTDEAGQVIQSYEYTGFGKITSQSGSLEQPFTFTGRELDQMLAQEETTSWITYSTEVRPGVQDPQGTKGGGRIEIKTLRQTEDLYYFRARYFDPRAGRFISKDPIGFAGGDVNLYRYVQNNPVNYADPYGELISFWHFGITYVAGRISGDGIWDSLKLAWGVMLQDRNSLDKSAHAANIHAMAGQLPSGQYQTPAEASIRTVDIIQNGPLFSAFHAGQDLPCHNLQSMKDLGFNWTTVKHVFWDIFDIPAVFEAYQNSMYIFKIRQPANEMTQPIFEQ